MFIKTCFYLEVIKGGGGGNKIEGLINDGGEGASQLQLHFIQGLHLIINTIN